MPRVCISPEVERSVESAITNKLTPFFPVRHPCPVDEHRAPARCGHPSVNAQKRFGDEDFLLIELPKQVLLERGNKPRAPITSEVQHGHGNDLIEIQALVSLPD